MEKLCQLNLCHLILSPSDKDEEKFKGYVPFIINWIFNKKSISFYSISEEMGEKGEHFHLDILIFAKTNIDTNILNNKGKQIGLAGHLKEFMINNLPSTTWGRFYKDKKENINKEKEHNIKFLIGYNQKETQENSELKNWNNLPIDSGSLIECIDYMKLHKVEKPVYTKDITPLNPKNAMFEMKKWTIKQNDEFNYDTLVSDTVKQGYCWLGMTEKTTRKLILQLKTIKGELEEEEEHELNGGVYKKFEDPELETLKMMRHRPHFERLKELYENNFLTKEEYEILMYCQLNKIKSQDIKNMNLIN